MKVDGLLFAHIILASRIVDLVQAVIYKVKNNHLREPEDAFTNVAWTTDFIFGFFQLQLYQSIVNISFWCRYVEI
jgi:hypothetical protein